MSLRPFLLLLPFVLWQCATPTPSPPTPLPGPVVPDDDHRSVSRAEFHGGPWTVLAPVTAWKARTAGVALTLSDGREVTLDFIMPSVVRWWVPPAPQERPLSPSAEYPELRAAVSVRETGGYLILESPALGVKLNLGDLSWSLIKGERTVLSSVGGPRVSGRRVAQAFRADDVERWVGPGLHEGSGSAKFWIDGATEAGETTPFAAPFLFGAGGALPVGISLDNSYQTYTRVTAAEATLGALNGGLDLLIAAASQPAAVVESLTALTGRPPLPPSWAHGTALSLPESESGAFLRRAKVSIQTAQGVFRADRPRFQALVPLSPWTQSVPDLTLPQAKLDWVAREPLTTLGSNAGISLAPVPGQVNWEARFDDGGLDSPMARMNNRLAGLAAQAASEAWQVQNPGLRPLVLAGSGGMGSVRVALPEWKIVATQDQGVLARVLALGAAGQGTPAIRLDLSAMGTPATKAAAFQSLASWLLAPILTLDWGSDPAGFWNALTEADRQRLRALLARRSELKPLLIQLARDSSNTGRPAWQPLWFGSPNDPRSMEIDDEFLLGNQLLVAPVPGDQTSRSVYLPGPGMWFDFWSGEELGGGRSYTLTARPDRPLVFARGGSLIPVREAEIFGDREDTSPLTIHVFPGGRGWGTYFVDDGRTLAWKTGGYWETRLGYDYSQKEMTLTHDVVNSTTKVKPDPYLLYRLHNVYKPRQVKIDGKPIPLFGESWGVIDSDRSAAWYESDHTLLIKTFRPERNQSIVMSF